MKEIEKDRQAEFYYLKDLISKLVSDNFDPNTELNKQSGIQDEHHHPMSSETAISPPSLASIKNGVKPLPLLNNTFTSFSTTSRRFMSPQRFSHVASLLSSRGEAKEVREALNRESEIISRLKEMKMQSKHTSTVNCSSK